MSEGIIQMFWEHGSGFELIENATSTIRSGKRWLKESNKKKRDIM
jgi:hypothetical protein